jgi:hypothetical protein
MECSVRLGAASCVYQLVRANLLQQLLRRQYPTLAFNYIIIIIIIYLFFSGHAASLTSYFVISYFSSWNLCWITISISIVVSIS